MIAKEKARLVGTLTSVAIALALIAALCTCIAVGIVFGKACGWALCAAIALVAIVVCVLIIRRLRGGDDG